MTDPPAILGDQLVALAGQGFTAFKIGWGPFGRRAGGSDEALVRAARDVVGDDALLAVDAGGSDAFWPGDLAWATRTARMLADYGIAWFEEPLSPDATTDLVALRGASPVPSPVVKRSPGDRRSSRTWMPARSTSSSPMRPRSANCPSAAGSAGRHRTGESG